MSEESGEFTIAKGRTEEAALLAACLRKPNLIPELSEIITPDCFSWIPYRDAWQAIQSLLTACNGIDPLTVGDELDRVDKLALFMLHDDRTFSGRLALSKMRDRGQPANARTYAETVQDYAAKRVLTGIASKVATWSMNGRRAIDILTDTEKLLASVNAGSGKAAKHTQPLAEAIRRASDRTERAGKGEITYMPTGYYDLDRLVTGFTAPDLWIVAGRPGMGKTAFLTSVAMNVLEKGRKVLFFTLEMGMEQIAMRMISMLSGTTYSEQLTGKIDDLNIAKYYDALGELSDNHLGLWLNDLPAINPGKIRQELRRVGNVDLVVIDYIQLASADQRYEVRNLEVASITKSLKTICKEFDVPIMAAAQLNRAGEARADKEPILSDLGESDELAKSADKVIFIHRDAYNSNQAKIIVAKQRNGPVGLCTLTYAGTKTKFLNPVKGIL